MEERWLQACKRLPIGGTARIRCCNRKPTAAIYNKEMSWDFYCFRCHDSKHERKEFITLGASVVEPDIAPIPEDMQDLVNIKPELRSMIYTFIVSKGLMPDMLPGGVKWSTKKQRLLFPVGDGTYLGRAMSPHYNPKWVTYGLSVAFAIAQPASPQNATEVVLTEDYLSALKLAYVSSKFFQSKVLPIALLGTRLSPRLRAGLVDMKLPVLVMLDGDTAGYAGTETVRKHLKPFLPLREFSVPGKDPKDLGCQQILEAFNGCSDLQSLM